MKEKRSLIQGVYGSNLEMRRISCLLRLSLLPEEMGTEGRGWVEMFDV